MVVSNRFPAITIPAFVIMMDPDRNCAPLRRMLREIIPRLRCIQATKRADVQMGPPNGTAYVALGSKGRSRLLHVHPPVHHKVFAVGALEVAILCSHLRAIGAGHASGASARSSGERGSGSRSRAWERVLYSCSGLRALRGSLWEGGSLAPRDSRSE